MSYQRLFLALLFYFFLNISLLKSIAQNAPEIPSGHQWTVDYKDPVELAKETIKRSPEFWNPLGYYATTGVYTIGFNAGRFGGAYILLESPNLVFDLVSGGLYKATSNITYDFFINLIQESVKTPDKLCKDLAAATIKEGLSDYEIAYNIARKFISQNPVSKKEALRFLAHRWGLFKLALARELYNNSNAPYSFEHSVAEKTTKELLSHFENNYQAYLGVENKLPLSKAAFFIKDLSDILKAKKIGLMGYPPYLQYIDSIEKLNQLRLSEARRFAEATTVMDKEMIIGLIIDSSGSMRDNDPRDIRKTAANLIIDRLTGTEDIFLVDFDDKANWLNVDQWHNWNKSSLKMPSSVLIQRAVPILVRASR